MLKEGCDIRSIGRIAGVSATTVLRKIKSLAGAVREPVIGEGQVFEMDELCTFVGSKSAPVWVVYAIDKHSKAVIRYNVGNRSLGVLGAVTLPLLCSQPQKIYTDKLVQYRSLIPGSLHSMRANGTNHIERKNLALRTHLKRLSRRTICFSKSAAMLAASLKIYFWG